MNNSMTYSDKNNVGLANREYSLGKNNLKKPVIVKGIGNIGTVSNVIDDPSTGLQMYVITDQPYDVAKNHSDQVTDVKVLFRGSTGLDKIVSQNKELSNDSNKDWRDNDIPMAKKIEENRYKQVKVSKSPHVTRQPKEASAVFNQLLKEYPNANFSLYAHSLGEINGSYALANVPVSEQKRIMQAHLYEGPNIYTLLTKKQQKNVGALKNKVFLYVDRKDMVPIGYEKGQEHIGTLVDVRSKNVRSITDQHEWGGYQFYHGSLKTKKDSRSLAIKLNRISILFNQYFGNQSSAGGEKVYLDAAEATETAIVMNNRVNNSIPKLINMEKERVQTAKSSWKNAYDAVANQGVDLNHNEIIECLHVGGLNYGEVVEKTEAEAEEAIAKFKRYKSTFDNLVSELKSSINKMVSDDAELAGMFKDLGL